MAALEAAMQWLRPLVDTNPWDYCVIWKLGDDPSRFIEWGACCCGHGRRGSRADVKTKDDYEVGGDCCRDRLVKHRIRGEACRRLARLPSSIPLYSGVHGDVVISKKPRWSMENGSSSSPSNDEANGTQVLIPVACGLIELFTREHVARDQKIIDYIFSRFQVPPKQEIPNPKIHFDFDLREPLCNTHPKSCLHHWIPPLHYVDVSRPSNYSSFEGSSTCSSLSNEQQWVKHVRADVALDKAESPSRNLGSKRKKHGVDCEFLKNRQKGEKGVYKSKNLVTERNRRKRIKDGVFALRALVPKISKMDRASTLSDAAEYIKELHETIEGYQDELEGMDQGIQCENFIPTNNKANIILETTRIEAQVEVNQLGPKEFLVKVICMQKRGGFSRLVEALDSLGLRVTDANATALNGAVSNILKVEASRREVELNTLKHSLFQLVT